MTHLNALQVRLSNERNYFAEANTVNEKALRKVWIAQIEKEIAFETKFIGEQAPEVDMTDDELLAALTE